LYTFLGETASSKPFKTYTAAFIFLLTHCWLESVSFCFVTAFSLQAGILLYGGTCKSEHLSRLAFMSLQQQKEMVALKVLDWVG